MLPAPRTHEDNRMPLSRSRPNGDGLLGGSEREDERDSPPCAIRPQNRSPPQLLEQQNAPTQSGGASFLATHARTGSRAQQVAGNELLRSSVSHDSGAWGTPGSRSNPKLCSQGHTSETVWPVRSAASHSSLKFTTLSAPPPSRHMDGRSCGLVQAVSHILSGMSRMTPERSVTDVSGPHRRAR